MGSKKKGVNKIKGGSWERGTFPNRMAKTITTKRKHSSVFGTDKGGGGGEGAGKPIQLYFL